MSVEVPVRLCDESAHVPTYAYVGDAGLDLYSAETLLLAPYERASVRCGIAVAIPQGYAGLVIPRSGLAAKHGISIVNSPGLIDSGYRGEIKVILVNLDAHESFEISQGDRIAQLVIVQTPHVSLIKTHELPQSERGEGGFGSSGI